ncbi:MAG TPA: hypothetical protein VI566_08215 [Xanthomonadales bacterium]|nr:hypothetical protein [Xanthomonadales bacterium]
MSRRKCIFIIVDGLGDLPIPAFDNCTPLEAARTPTLDRLAAAGVYGPIDPMGLGITPNTDSGTGMLLGMFPADAESLKRGPVEAAGARLVLRDGDVALRANFASIQPAKTGFVVTDRRAGRVRHDAVELGCAIRQLDLGDGVSAQFRNTEQHRGVLVLSGPGLSAAITATDPGEVPLPAPLPECQALEPAAGRTAEKVNLFTRMVREVLEKHPVNATRAAAGMQTANCVIVRGAGAPVSLRNVITGMGLSAALVSGCNTVRGLGRIFGFEIITDPRFTADVDTDLDAKMLAALAALRQHDLCFLHIKAPDICAHDRQPEAKRQFIERLDKAMVPLLRQDLVTALAADHSTDSNTGMHTADPVPALLHRPGSTMRVTVVKFGEKSCGEGTMPRQTSSAFLQRVLEYTL